MFDYGFPETWSTIKKLAWLRMTALANALVTIGPASILSFMANKARPIDSLTVALEPIQSGTGDPSPDNVRPISGHSTVNVWRTGVNVWDEEWEGGRLDYDKNSPTWGQNVGGGNQIRSKNYISVIPGEIYYGVNTGDGNVYAIFYDAAKNPVEINGNGYGDIKNKTFTVPASARFMRFYVTTITTYSNNISINYPSTDHDYHAYTGTTATISLGTTVYGGTLDVVSGVLTVDRAKIVWNGTGVNWIQSTGYVNRFTYTDADLGASGDITKYMSNMLTPTQWGITKYSFSIRTSGAVYIMLDDTAPQMTADEFKAWLADNNIEVCYELAQPQTVQLTATQLSTLLGENHVWTDAGEVTLTAKGITEITP